jgi:hypothetical protein
MASVQSIVTLVELGGLAYVAWRIYTFLHSGDLEDLPLAGWVGDYFEAVAWQTTVPPDDNQELVDYCISHNMTAEKIALAVENETPLTLLTGYKYHGRTIIIPEIQVLDWSHGYSYLQYFYVRLKESTVFGSGSALGGLIVRGSDDLCYQSIRYTPWREWCDEQLQEYQTFCQHFGLWGGE